MFPRKATSLQISPSVLGSATACGNLPIYRCVGRIERPHRCVEMNLAFQFSGETLEVGETWSHHGGLRVDSLES